MHLIKSQTSRRLLWRQYLQVDMHKSKPCERGFSNVKGMIQDNEIEGQRDPFGLINRCFHHYSFQGKESSAGESYTFLCI